MFTATKVNKCAIVREAIASLGNDLSNKKRIIDESQRRLSQLPLDQRRGIRLDQHDVDNAIRMMKKNGALATHNGMTNGQPMNGNGRFSLPSPAVQASSIAPNSELVDAFSSEELRCAQQVA